MDAPCPRRPFSPGAPSLTTLVTVHTDAFSHLARHLDAKSLVRLEMVCSAFASKIYVPPGAAPGTPPASCMDVAAHAAIQSTDRTVSFLPRTGESWKRLLWRIEVFLADRYPPGTHGPPQLFTDTRWSFRPQLFSKTFLEMYEQGTEGGNYAGSRPRDDCSQIASTMLPRLVQWLEHATASGSATAAYALGCHYEVGAGVKLDVGRARALYQRAADKHSRPAKQALRHMNERGFNVHPTSFGQGEEDTIEGPWDGGMGEAEGKYHPTLGRQFKFGTPTVPVSEAEWTAAGINRDGVNPQVLYAVLMQLSTSLRQAGKEMAKQGIEEFVSGETDELHRYATAKELDAIAFVGNSIAFHVGRWSDITGEDFQRGSDDGGTTYKEKSDHGTHAQTIVYECRSACGVLTLKELFFGIDATVWLNSTFAGHHCDNNRFSGLLQLCACSGERSFHRQGCSCEQSTDLDRRVDYRTHKPESLVFQNIYHDDLDRLKKNVADGTWPRNALEGALPIHIPDETSIYRTQSLEEATGAASDTGPVAGEVAASEVKRLRDSITHSTCPGGPYGRAAAHLRRQEEAVPNAVMQNDFAAVGAGAIRFVMRWS